MILEAETDVFGDEQLLDFRKTDQSIYSLGEQRISLRPTGSICRPFDRHEQLTEIPFYFATTLPSPNEAEEQLMNNYINPAHL